MKNINRNLVIILLLVDINLSAQKIQNKDNYDYLVREEMGDLNNDGKTDRITVKMDTVNETRPFRVQILLSQPNGKLTLAVSSDQMVEPQYPVENQGNSMGTRFPIFLLKKGYYPCGVRLKVEILRTISDTKMGILN